MKNKIIIIVGVGIIILAMIICPLLISRNSSSFTLENQKDGNIVVKTKNVSGAAGGIGYITLKENQNLEVETNISNKGYIKIEVYPSDNVDNIKALVEEKFKGKDNHSYRLPAGKYTIRINAAKKATGTMYIDAV